MFKNVYQNGLLSIFYSGGANPLAIWDMEVHNGHIKRLTDCDVNSLVLEIVSTNVATTYITCPKNKNVLGIKLPYLVMIIKNLKRYFSFEITILDDKNLRRRFRISNFQSTTKIKPFCTSMPIGLSGGWNQIQFNLAEFTKRAYGTQFIETLRVQIHANARLRRIYFSDRLYSEEELPQDYKLYLPLEKKTKKLEKKPEDKPVPPQPPVAEPAAQIEAPAAESAVPPVEPAPEPPVDAVLEHAPSRKGSEVTMTTATATTEGVDEAVDKLDEEPAVETLTEEAPTEVKEAEVEAEAPPEGTEAAPEEAPAEAPAEEPPAETEAPGEEPPGEAPPPPEESPAAE